MNRYNTLVILIMFILIAILFANLKHKTEELLEQEDKIINLQIELDSEKEKSYQLELEKKRGVLNE